MAEKTLDTRIILKYDLLSNWNSSSLILKKGELAIAEIPSAASESGLTPPAIGVKVGDGINTFSNLGWIQAIAGDVQIWAKAPNKPLYTASEISAEVTAGDGKTVESRLGALEGATSIAASVYRIIKDSSTNKWYLQKKTVGAPDTDFTTINTIDLVDILAAKQDALVFDGTYNSSTNKVATESTVENASSALRDYVDTKTAGLTGAMHFAGSVATIPPSSGTYNEGDVVLLTSTNKEYVYDGSNWIELGDEGSYAIKTITITAGNGLTGGGTLESNRTIAHEVPSGAGTSNNITATTGQFINAITFDDFGHVTSVGTGSAAAYTFEEGTTDGAFKVTPAGGQAQSVAIHGLGTAAFEDLSDLSGSATATAADSDQYSVLTGVTETNGVISKTSEVKLAAIAKTGNVNDLIQTSGDVLILNCGSSTEVI